MVGVAKTNQEEKEKKRLARDTKVIICHVI